MSELRIRAERRERIAVAIMAGLAANSEYDPTPVQAAHVAVEWAEMLICALDDAEREDAKGGMR